MEVIVASSPDSSLGLPILLTLLSSPVAMRTFPSLNLYQTRAASWFLVKLCGVCSDAMIGRNQTFQMDGSLHIIWAHSLVRV